MTVCPSCGKESLKKLLSAAGFQLKGSGWYATDFKGSGGKPASKSPEGGEKAATDVKPAGDAPAGDKATAAPAADKPLEKGTPAAKATPASTSD